MYYVIRKGTEYYAGLNPVGQKLFVPTLVGAAILSGEDATRLVSDIFDVATICRVTVS